MTTTRPPEFDAALLASLPTMRRMANRIDAANRDDLINETIAFACERWTNFRGAAYGAGSGFLSWLRINMRAIAGRPKWRGRLDVCSLNDIDIEAQRIDPPQEAAADAAIMVDMLKARGRDGEIVLRKVAGLSVAEAGEPWGLSEKGTARVLRAERDRVAGMV